VEVPEKEEKGEEVEKLIHIIHQPIERYICEDEHQFFESQRLNSSYI